MKGRWRILDMCGKFKGDLVSQIEVKKGGNFAENEVLGNLLYVS